MKMWDFMDEIAVLIAAYLKDDTTAQQKLYALSEDAMVAIMNAYYAGVTNKQGIALIELTGAIGGFEAMSLLRDVFYFEQKRADLRHAAAIALRQNRHNLSQHEQDELDNYFDADDRI